MHAWGGIVIGKLRLHIQVSSNLDGNGICSGF
jgi:hypothetical protein